MDAAHAYVILHVFQNLFGSFGILKNYNIIATGILTSFCIHLNYILISITIVAKLGFFSHFNYIIRLEKC